MRITVLLGILLLFVSIRSADGTPLRLTCTFQDAALATIDNNRAIDIRLDRQEPMTVTFDGLDSDSPSLAFEVGSARTRAGRLEVIRTEVGILWLAQSGELGEVDYWTLFLKQNIALLSRHSAHEAVTLQRPVGMMAMGNCR